MREITQTAREQLNLPDLLTTDAKQYVDGLQRIIILRNQSYYQIGQFLLPMRELAEESPEAFKQKFQFDSFDDFLTASIKDGGCGFPTPKQGHRMIHALLYGAYVRSMLTGPHAERVFDVSYDAMERIESVENHLVKEEKGGFDKNTDTLKEVVTSALVMDSRGFRKNVSDIKNGSIKKITPEPLGSNQRLAVAWGRLYDYALDNDSELVKRMQDILDKVK